MRVRKFTAGIRRRLSSTPAAETDNDPATPAVALAPTDSESNPNPNPEARADELAQTQIQTQTQTPAAPRPVTATVRIARSPRAMALVIGIAALTAYASESELVHDIQRYCAVCWKNARLDPGLWDDCTQEVCCRLLAKARAGELDLNNVLAEDTPERRELIRAIDMVRKRVQRARKHQPLDDHAPPGALDDERARASRELGEILEAARAAVLTPRQDRIVEMWTSGWSVPEIAAVLAMPVARVSDQKYKALRKLERHLVERRDELGLPLPGIPVANNTDQDQDQDQDQDDDDHDDNVRRVASRIG